MDSEMEGFILKPQEAKKKIENLEVLVDGHYTFIIKNTKFYKPLGGRDKSRIKTVTLRSVSGQRTVGLQQRPSKGEEEEMQVKTSSSTSTSFLALLVKKMPTFIVSLCKPNQIYAFSPSMKLEPLIMLSLLCISTAALFSLVLSFVFLPHSFPSQRPALTKSLSIYNLPLIHHSLVQQEKSYSINFPILTQVYPACHFN